MARTREQALLFIFLVLGFLMTARAFAQSRTLLVQKEEIAYSLQGSISNVPWKIARTEWAPVDENGYSRFIEKLGEGIAQGKCGTVAECLKNTSVNIFASTDPAGLKLYADCADFPYFLRAYYAWRNLLPFGFVSGIRPIQGKGEVVRDVRYSPYGNTVSERFSVTAKRSSLGRPKYTNAIDVFNKLLPNRISSGTFRISYTGMDDDILFSDFYPVKITREAIRPGTVIYDPNGHVVTVYKVTRDGRVYYIDAHPDNSLTAGLYNSRFMRSYPGQGAGFKNWRPVSLVGATWSEEYGFIGGELRGAKDRALPLFSTEQYYGTSANPNWKEAKFSFQGQEMKYLEWVRNRLADGPLVANPVDDVKIMTQEVCNSVRERRDAVDVAIKAGLDRQAHPSVLPRNIFGAEGDWETYATPARDARLKVAFKEIRTYVEEALNHHRTHDGKVSYYGPNLAGEMLTAYKKTAEACVLSYQNSNGQTVKFNLEQARTRVYDFSFDPYHCAELRWGARGDELNTCRDDANKRAWYDAQKWLRFQHERNTEAFTGFRLDQLNGPMPGVGVAQGEDLDIIAFLTKNQ